ncbi:MAG: septal ring lytic transglycosylase RlpA family protein [Proteobacteria bacterium]|nr:septal ring lytic transglycosylase RlpA family protein [Pseudomonadota bacterium]
MASCAETRLVLHAAKKLSNPPQTESGNYKVGNPYRIGGVWYYPKVDYSYRETGVASWYGAKFHNQLTANGQIFDMNAISAAHKTLPLPSIVQVTNLTNGRSLKVLVNDRGPFAHGRIIDLSRRAAQLLGFERAGIARVRVEIIAPESRRLANLANLAQRGNSTGMIAAEPSVPVRIASLPADGSADVKVVPVSSNTNLFVQAGSFVRRDLARQMERDLAPIGPTQIVEATVGKQLFYRVRLGPVETVNDGDRILDAVVRTGYPNAQLVVY